MSWTPTDSQLFKVMDSAVDLDYRMTYSPLAGETVNSYEWSLSPDPQLFSVSSSDAGVRLQASQLSGLFHPDSLKYRNGDELGEATSWDAIPAGADLYEFHPTSDGQRDYTITVTAHINFIDPLTADEQSYDVQQAWTMTIRHDFSSGRTLLENFIHASSHT